MNLKCICGASMSDGASPNEIEHMLLSDRAMENVQDLVDGDVGANGEVQMWPEHWEASGGTEVWKCPQCDRLYVNPRGDLEGVIIYNVERVGLPQ